MHLSNSHQHKSNEGFQTISSEHIRPIKLLAPYVFAYAFLQVPKTTTPPNYQHLLPAGTVIINFELGGQLKGFLPNHYGELTPPIYIVGQTTFPHGILPIGELLHISIVFFPVGFYSVLGIPAAEFTNKVIAINDVWGQAWIWLGEQLMEAPNNVVRAKLLDRFLLEQMQIQGCTPTIANEAIALWNQFPVGISIQETIQELRISARHFRRKFKEEVGVNPKMYLRLKRFHHFLNLMKSHTILDLSQAIHDSGYFDYAHFSKEFKRFAQFSPQEYFKQQGQNDSLIREKYVLWKGR